MKAVILAAGLGTRLGELTKNRPKCLVEINGKSILENQADILRSLGISDITVVMGNEGESWTKENQGKIRKINKNIVINFENSKTSNSYSLKLALDNMGEDDLLIVDGDVAFSSKLIENILNKKENLIVAKTLEKNIQGNRVIIGSSSKVSDVGRNLTSEFVHGGLIKISKSSFNALKELVNKKEYYSLDTGFVLEEFCKHNLLSCFIDKSLININTKDDLEESKKLFSKKFIVVMFGYTGVGKSTIAKRIANIPETEIFHSAVIRKELNLSPKTKEDADKFFDYRNNLREEVDKKVYSKLAESAAAVLVKGKNVVLDAGYFFSWQRQLVYDKVKVVKPEIIIVKVICPNEEEIKRRLNERADKFNENPLNETPSWNTYLATKLVTEPLDKDSEKSNLNIVEYDTLNKTFNFLTKNKSENLNAIIESIRVE